MAEVTVEHLSPEEGAALFESACRTYDIPPAQFLTDYATGVAWSRWEHDAVTHLSMLIPFARAGGSDA